MKVAVLIADDNEEMSAVLAEILSWDGHYVETATDGRIALERLRARPFDLVLSDVRMAGMDGPSLYRALAQQEAPSRPLFVFMTGDADTLPKATLDLVEQTAIPMLRKPLMMEDVEQLVNRLLTDSPR